MMYFLPTEEAFSNLNFRHRMSPGQGNKTTVHLLMKSLIAKRVRKRKRDREIEGERELEEETDGERERENKGERDRGRERE